MTTPVTGTDRSHRVGEIEDGTLGRVKACWGNDGQGPFSATLAFRIGEADERLRTRGRCHLVRALVLDGLDTVGVEIRGSVTTLRTRFEITGDEPAVATALTAITRRLGALRTDRVESIIADVESAWRPPARWDTELMSLRFGSRGYGLPALPLLGLRDLDVGAFDDWVRTWFTAQNAVLSCNRPPSEGLDLGALGDGVPKALPEPHQVVRALPGLATGPDEHLSVSFLSRFDSRAILLSDLIVDRLHARCVQIDSGIARPVSVARRTGPGLATFSLSLDAPDSSITELQAALSSELFDLSMNGPDDDELARARIAYRRGRHRSSDGSHRTISEYATALLFDEALDAHAALGASRAQFADVIRDGLTRAIWSVPASVTIADRRLLPIGDAADGSGSDRNRPVGADIAGPRGTVAFDEVGPAPGESHPRRLVVSDRAVALVPPAGAATVLAFDDIVALEIHPDDARTLWGVDGTRIVVDPGSWQHDGEILEAIDTHVEPWVCLHVQTGSDGS